MVPKIALAFISFLVFIQDVKSSEDISDTFGSVIIHAIIDGVKEHRDVDANDAQNKISDRETFIDNDDDKVDPNVGVNDYGEYEYFPDTSGQAQKEIPAASEIRSLDDDDNDGDNESDVVAGNTKMNEQLVNSNVFSTESPMPPSIKCRLVPTLPECVFLSTFPAPDENSTKQNDDAVREEDISTTSKHVQEEELEVDNVGENIIAEDILTVDETTVRIYTDPDSKNEDYQDIEEIEDRIIDRDQYDIESPEELLAEVLLKDGIITW